MKTLTDKNLNNKHQRECISLNLAKKLKVNGCDLFPYKIVWFPVKNKQELVSYNYVYMVYDKEEISKSYPAYGYFDILVTFKKEFFGKKKMKEITQELLVKLQSNKTKEDIDSFIWYNCLFNPQNK